MLGDRTVTHGADFAPIPRILHQTWKTGEVPEQWAAYQASWRLAHPGWEYRLWTDADNRRLIEEAHPWFLDTYDRFPRDIQRVDAAKYFILYTHGGVYADLDCECVRPLDPLLAGGGAIVSRTRDGVIDCAILASPPGHRLWPQVFADLQQPPFSARALRHTPGFHASYVLFSTGTRMMKRRVGRYAARLDAAADGLTILDPKYFSSRSWLDRYDPFPDADTFVRHHYTDSWLRPGERLIHAWYTRRVATVGLAIIALVAVLAALLMS